MRICICDDEISQCDVLKEMILAHGAHAVTVYHSAEELLFECENNYAFDCIFLDIQMKGINGIECARKIREKDSHVILVFLSAISDYVFEGYEVNAIRYLLKPLNVQKCHELLDIIQNSIEKESAYLLINKTKINCDDITYIESYGHYCSIHAKEVIESKISIGELCRQLPDEFIQVHRSFLVNLKHVEAIQKDQCILEDQSIIPISRSSVKKVNEAFMAFIKGGLYL